MYLLVILQIITARVYFYLLIITANCVVNCIPILRVPFAHARTGIIDFLSHSRTTLFKAQSLVRVRTGLPRIPFVNV